MPDPPQNRPVKSYPVQGRTVPRRTIHARLQRLAARPLRLAALGVGISAALALAFALVPLLLPPPDVGSAEVRFLQMMRPHHAQALELVDRAGPKLRDPEVRNLAHTIRRAQMRELAQMEALLRAWGHRPHTAPLSRAHGAAMGMVSPADLTRLGTLPPAETEVLFLQLMRRHHEGAVAMSGPLLGWRVRPQLRELAQHVELAQKTEVQQITRMLEARGARPLGPPSAAPHDH